MPKDEFDFDDPMELSGVGFLTEEDTTDAMCECFIEEFMRMGYNHKQVLALFRNPYYLGMNMVLQNRGEPFVRDRIGEVFARWGKKVEWRVLDPAKCGDLPSTQSQSERPVTSMAANEWDSNLTDPTGGAIPKIKL